jgi:hypothetical protein
MDQVHVIASSKIVWQNFDDELIVIHLESGIYYILNRSGASVWRMLEAGLAPAEAAQRGGNGSVEARAAALEFWRRLVEENPIRSAPAANSSRTSSLEDAPAESAPGETPSITVFKDMQDLFLLDPIHDVDDAGWPSYRADSN